MGRYNGNIILLVCLIFTEHLINDNVDFTTLSGSPVVDKFCDILN